MRDELADQMNVTFLLVVVDDFPKRENQQKSPEDQDDHYRDDNDLQGMAYEWSHENKTSNLMSQKLVSGRLQNLLQVIGLVRTAVLSHKRTD